jgi:RsiW-degrading membrane proteinase PrsW (M82 family)
LLTLLVSAAPSVALLGYFYFRDRFEREPLQHVAGAFVLGMYAMIAAHGLAVTAEGWVPEAWLRTGGEPARLFDAFVLSGLIEELSKWVILMAAILHWREFDEPLDGLVYGVAVALGFATLENFYYVSSRGVAIGWQRALFAVPAHALFGGAMGYYVGRAKFDRGGKRWLERALSLAIPTAFHGAYDYALEHRLDWKIWGSITVLSLGFWVFVLRRVFRAQRASPYRPKTMLPTMLPPQHRPKK